MPNLTRREPEIGILPRATPRTAFSDPWKWFQRNAERQNLPQNRMRKVGESSGRAFRLSSTLR